LLSEGDVPKRKEVTMMEDLLILLLIIIFIKEIKGLIGTSDKPNSK